MWARRAFPQVALLQGNLGKAQPVRAADRPNIHRPVPSWGPLQAKTAAQSNPAVQGADIVWWADQPAIIGDCAMGAATFRAAGWATADAVESDCGVRSDGPLILMITQ